MKTYYNNQEVEVTKDSQKIESNGFVTLTVKVKENQKDVRVKMRELVFFRKRQYEKNK